MKTSLKLSLITGLLCVGGFVYAQGPMSGRCDGMGQHSGMQGMMHDRMGKIDPARRQVMLDKRHAALKTELKITAAQEAAWIAYADAMKPGAGVSQGQRPDPAGMAKLTTPERLDKMQALRAQHMSEMSATMEKHAQATKALYAVLSPEQQKVFDAQAMPGQHRAMGQQKGFRGGHGAGPGKQG